MKEECKKCKSEQDYVTTVSLGRRLHKCLKCGNMEFEDENPGSGNTTESWNSSPTV